MINKFFVFSLVMISQVCAFESDNSGNSYNRDVFLNNRINQNIALATITSAGAFYASSKAVSCLQNKLKKHSIVQGNVVGGCVKVALTAGIVCSTLLVKVYIDWRSDCQALGDAMVEILKNDLTK